MSIKNSSKTFIGDLECLNEHEATQIPEWNNPHSYSSKQVISALKAQDVKSYENSLILSKKVSLQATAIGEAYVETIKKGPFVRFSNSQEDHHEAGLLFWFKSTGAEDIKKISTDAADKGSILHGYFETILECKNPKVNHEWAKKPIENFRELVSKYKITASRLELGMVSHTLGLGGRCDFEGTAEIPGGDGSHWLLDWKTGGVHDSYNAQLAVYSYMHQDSGYLPRYKNLGIGQIHRDGKITKIIKVENESRWFKAALHTFERWKLDRYATLRWGCAPLDVWEARKKTRGKKRKQFEESQWREEYKWPWLDRNSLEDAADWINELKERESK